MNPSCYACPGAPCALTVPHSEVCSGKVEGTTGTLSVLLPTQQLTLSCSYLNKAQTTVLFTTVALGTLSSPTYKLLRAQGPPDTAYLAGRKLLEAVIFRHLLISPECQQFGDDIHWNQAGWVLGHGEGGT